MNTRRQMDIEVADELDERLQAQWNEFYESLTHQHPRQSLPFIDVDKRFFHGIRYAIGRVDGRIVACAAFILWRHPYLKSMISEARCMCGPLCDDPELMLRFSRDLLKHPSFKSIGQVSISPYWVEEEARTLTALANTDGWTNYEKRDEYRKTGIIDLTLTHDELLARFSKSARRYYRKSTEHMKVESRPITSEKEANRFYEIMELTLGGRNITFYKHEYYMDLFKSVLRNGQYGTIIGAYIGDDMLGGTLIFRSSVAGIGRILVMDTPLIKKHGKVRLSPFLLMSSFMWAQERGCIRFDLEGYDDPENSPKSLKNVNEYKSKVSPKAVVRFADHKRVNNRAIHLTGNLKQITKSNLRMLRRKFNRSQA